MVYWLGRRIWAGYTGGTDCNRKLLQKAVRCLDPSFKITRKWVLRRLSPDCCRIELADLPVWRDELQLLLAMGWETANLHLGTGNRSAILRHLRKNLAQPLNQCALAMVAALREDWKQWRAHMKRTVRARHK